jgi:hypothetical protein
VRWCSTAAPRLNQIALPRHLSAAPKPRFQGPDADISLTLLTSANRTKSNLRVVACHLGRFRAVSWWAILGLNQ